MRRSPRVALSVTALFILAGAMTPALGATPDPGGTGCAISGVRAPRTISIDGQEYGAKDGLKVDTFECVIEPGSGEVGMVFPDTQGSGGITPMVAWGSSYAISVEWANMLGYDGKAKADANIFAGKRIIQVCMWYTENGVKVSPVVCSNAASVGGSWLSGPEKRMSQNDNLNPFAPKTVFNVSTARFNP